ncbi:hypothetical protein QBD01_003763 [Ochrobactrum sp. 19YEA23]|nr:hypothetical protein [Ochrobactrum sp. 19YEA23]
MPWFPRWRRRVILLQTLNNVILLVLAPMQVRMYVPGSLAFRHFLSVTEVGSQSFVPVSSSAANAGVSQLFH